jgi:hypothetical protein
VIALPSSPAIRACAQSAADKVNYREVDIPAPLIVPIIEWAIVEALRCFRQDFPATTPEEAKAHLVEFNTRHPSLAHRRVKVAARKAASDKGNPISRRSASELARAIIADAIETSDDVVARAFAACVEGGG